MNAPRHARPAVPLRAPSALWQVAAAVAVVIVVVILGARTGPGDGPVTPDPVAVGTTGAPNSPPPTAVASPEPAPADPEILTIQIRPTATVWVAGTADGTTAVYKLLQPGEDVTVTGRDMHFRVGNAGAFAYSINGVKGKPVGTSGEVRAFRITTENFRSFLPVTRNP